MRSKKSKNLPINRIYIELFLHLLIFMFSRSDSPAVSEYAPRCSRVRNAPVETGKASCSKLRRTFFFCLPITGPQSWASCDCDWLSSLWPPSHWTPERGFDWLTVTAGGVADSQRQDCIVPLRYHIPAWLLQHSLSSRSMSAFGTSPNSCASLACIIGLLTR